MPLLQGACLRGHDALWPRCTGVRVRRGRHCEAVTWAAEPAQAEYGSAHRCEGVAGPCLAWNSLSAAILTVLSAYK